MHAHCELRTDHSLAKLIETFILIVSIILEDLSDTALRTQKLYSLSPYKISI